MSESIVVLNNQLFDPKYLKKIPTKRVFLAESMDSLNEFKFHKNKIFLSLSSLRHYKEELESNGFEVHYSEIDSEQQLTLVEKISLFINKHKIKTIYCFEIEDKRWEKEIITLCRQTNVKLSFITSPMFFVSREEFQTYLTRVKRPLMRTFYEGYRKKTKILMNDGQPKCGKYSFDSLNRKKLPRDYKEPVSAEFPPDEIDKKVMAIVEQFFPSNLGEINNFRFPRQRKDAKKTLRHFAKKKLPHFGDYQDALSHQHRLMSHSLISTSLNTGLLSPKEVVRTALIAYEKKEISINSTEGFIRQILGWREFVRGIYQNHSDKMKKSNFWGHHRSMKACWYQGTTGIPPLDDTIKAARQSNYNHHIERLMILSNLMNLCEINPQEVYSWFMEHHIDAADWVMTPNVYGMGLMSDGGLFATKPYISGSNYVLKMSDYIKGDWCSIWDGLYWRFIDRHQDFFKQNPRMSIMVRSFEKLDPIRKQHILKLGEDFIQSTTT